jgi:hypothetical protein
MKKSYLFIRILGVLVLSAGVLLGIALAAVSVWGDFEATRFDAALSQLRDASLTSFRCPVIMTTQESSTVRATVKNPLDRPITLTVRTDVSNYLNLIRENRVQVPLDPGQREKLEWAVTPDDVVYGNLILVKALQFRQYPLPGRLGSCGIVVLDVPFLSGGLIVALAFAASLLGMVGGIGLWSTGRRPWTKRNRQAARTMGALAGSVVAGMVSGILGWWMLALIILAVNVLLTGAIIGHFMNSPLSS